VISDLKNEDYSEDILPQRSYNDKNFVNGTYQWYLRTLGKDRNFNKKPRVAQKSKPQSRIIIKSQLKPAIKARFFISFDYKMSTRI